MQRLALFCALLLVSGVSAESTLEHRLVQWGELAPGDALGSTTSFMDEYRVACGPGTVRIRLRSTEFDTYLEVVGPDGTEYSNDDFGRDQNSGLDIQAEKAGTWIIRSLALDAGEIGQYVLVVRGSSPDAAASAIKTTARRVDQFMLHDGSHLSGDVKTGSIMAETALGRVRIAASDLVSISMDNRGRYRLAQRSGQRSLAYGLQGALQLQLATGEQVQLQAKQLKQAQLRHKQQAPKPGPYALLAGNRMSVRWSADACLLHTAMGPLQVPTQAIRAIYQPNAAYPLGAVQLRDGSVIAGSVAALPIQAVGITADLSTAAVVVVHGEAQMSKPSLLVRTRSGDRLYAQCGNLTLATAGGLIPVAGTNLQRLHYEDGVLTCQLHNGGLVSGRPQTESLQLSCANGLSVVLPLSLLYSAQFVKAKPGAASKLPSNHDRVFEALVERLEGTEPALRP